ncbi:hypothetical protein A9Q99_00015 [Gammaproteobacteria bacterium 45_16_T64]|nr:hypothetical protein A9Q99_00015 [Gammaproteobacteria bacterium 45_16_T64]
MNKCLTSVILVYVLCTQATVLNAKAEDLSEFSLERLLEVEITVASAFTEDQLTSSSSVTVVGRQQWRRYASRNSHDVSTHIPSTMSYPSLGSGSTAVRGYGNTSSGIGLATLLDGVPINSLAFSSSQWPTPNLSLETLDRIEMIRGPGSALYGSDAFHGVFAQSTYMGNESELEGTLSLGHRGYYQTALRGARLFNNGSSLSMAISGDGQPDQDIRYEYMEPFTSTEHSSQYENNYHTESLSLRFDNEGERKGAYQRAGIYVNNHDGVDFPGTGKLFGSNQQRDKEHIDLESSFYMARADMGYRFDNEFQLEINTAYWESQLDHLLDFSQVTPAFLGGVSGFQLTRNRENKRLISLVAQQSDSIFDTDWVIETSYSESKITDNRSRFFDTNYTLLSDTESNSTGFDRRSKSAVFQAKTWFLGRKLAALYGGRIDDFSDIGIQRSPRLGFIVQPDRKNAYKYLFGRAFRNPSANEINGVGVAPGNPNLSPEVIDTHELIYMHVENRWRLEVVLFYSDWKDGIILDGTFENSGNNKAMGIELIAEGSIDDWLWRSSYSYIESENTTTDIEYGAFPKMIVNADIGYHFQGKGIEVNVSNRINYDVDEGPTTSVDPNPDSLPHYWRVDLQVTKFYGDQSEVSVSILNLFDRENYVPSIWNSENGIADQEITLQLDWRHALF